MAFGILTATKQIVFDTDVPLYDLEWSYFNWAGQTPSGCANHNVDRISAGITIFEFNTPHIYHITLNHFDYNVNSFVYRSFIADLRYEDEVIITIRGLMYPHPGDPGTPVGN